MTKHLLKNLDFIDHMKRDRPLSLFLDYDGTLTPIVARPHIAHLSFDMRELLRSIQKAHRLVIISGRSLNDLRGLVNLEGVVYAGNHGLEIYSPSFTMVFDTGRGFRAEAKGMEERFKSMGLRFRGIQVENKGLTITVHYRHVNSRDLPFFIERFSEAASVYVKKNIIKVTHSKMAFELRPNVTWDKGKAVEWLMDRKGFDGTLPVYIGDDDTDKDGFKAVNALKGISVFVGSPIEEADYFLTAPDEVKVFLKWLLHHPLAGERLLTYNE